MIGSETDRALMLSDFGTTVTHSGGSFQGILQREYVENQGMSGYHPVLTARTSDVQALALGTEFTIDSVQYEFRVREPDDFQMTRLILSLAAP